MSATFSANLMIDDIMVSSIIFGKIKLLKTIGYAALGFEDVSWSRVITVKEKKKIQNK